MAGEDRLADPAPVARAWPVRAGGVVRCIVAALLLVAAGLEAHQLATEPTAGTGILSARWFRMGWAEFELFLGVWLLTGVYPMLSWLTAWGCFMVFSGVTLAKALDGQDSCGCFGKVEVNPWYTFTLDVAVVLGMLAFRGGGYSARP
ncbi:MAG: hypothetical protein NT031_06775, partial [Planctomycetota bacterium]|nr:hypothetical protein [Planctomycetota bacterium]